VICPVRSSAQPKARMSTMTEANSLNRDSMPLTIRLNTKVQSLTGLLYLTQSPIHISPDGGPIVCSGKTRRLASGLLNTHLHYSRLTMAIRPPVVISLLPTLLPPPLGRIIPTSASPPPKLKLNLTKRNTLHSTHSWNSV
jgi:hypothetical protein